MESINCVICQLIIPNSKNKINIQESTTKIGNVNLEQFIKHTIFEVGTESDLILRSDFVCEQCFAAINILEDHYLLYKTIQQSLVYKFNGLDNNSTLKIEIFEDTGSEVVKFEENSTNDNKSSEGDQESVFNDMNNRKSTRVKKLSPNYTEEFPSSSVYTSTPKQKKIKKFPLPSEKPEYCCEICGKQYVNYNGFNIHRRKHRNENLIRCEYCDKTFTQKIGLRRHLHMHTGTFPFECNICQKKFVHSSSYKFHKQIHEGKRDYICDTCGMAFYSKTHLRSHINRHTKEKVHACDDCGATFTEKYNMRAHRLKVHGIKC